MNRIRRTLDHLSWAELAVLGALLFAIVANAAAGEWLHVGLLLCVGALFVAANYWRTEYEAEAESHDFTQHQLDEARAEVRRLSGDAVRWVDFGGDR